MHRKTIYYDVYKIKVVDKYEKAVSFKDLLLSEQFFKPIQRGENFINIIDRPKHNFEQLITAAIGNTQMVDIPPAYNVRTSEKKTLQLNEEEGLLHASTFIYDPLADIILLESNKNGVSIENLCSWIFENFQMQATTQIVLDTLEINKLVNFKRVASIEVSFASFNPAALSLKTDNYSIKDQIKMANDLNADNLSLKISVGIKHSLSKSKIADFVSFLSKFTHQSENSVTKLKVTGKNSEEEATKVYDLITQRLRLKIIVVTQRNNDEESLVNKYSLILNEYRVIRESIKETYG